MNRMTWGVEFETELLYYHKKGKDRNVLWSDEKVQITSEFWDVTLFHKPLEDDTYKVLGKETDDVKGVFNLEAQIGIFKGLGGLDSCMEAIDTLQAKFEDIVESQKIKSFPIFGFSKSEDDSDFFLDKDAKIPGSYLTDQPEIVAGYRTDISTDDIIGKPQLTCSFDMSLIIPLFELLSKHGTMSELKEPLAYTKQYSSWIHSSPSIQGFLFYLLMYLEHYRYYQEKVKEDELGYFKSVFDVKPRTNPAVLFRGLSIEDQKEVYLLKTLLVKKSDLDDRFSDDVSVMIGLLDNKNCVYTKDLPGVTNAMYIYDMEDETNVIGYQQYRDNMKRVPCIHPYDPNELLKSKIPYLQFQEDEEFQVDGDAPVQIWEWGMTEPHHVAFEFRNLRELCRYAIELQYGDEETEFDALLESESVTLEQLKEILYLIFGLLESAFPSSIRRTSKKIKKTKKSKKQKRTLRRK